MKLEHFCLDQAIDVDIKKVDKIEITDVGCLTGPMNTLAVTKNNYPKFDELLSILEKYNGRSMCRSYIRDCLTSFGQSLFIVSTG